MSLIYLELLYLIERDLVVLLNFLIFTIASQLWQDHLLNDFFSPANLKCSHQQSRKTWACFCTTSFHRSVHSYANKNTLNYCCTAKLLVSTRTNLLCSLEFFLTIFPSLTLQNTWKSLAKFSLGLSPPPPRKCCCGIYQNCIGVSDTENRPLHNESFYPRMW